MTEEWAEGCQQVYIAKMRQDGGGLEALHCGLRSDNIRNQLGGKEHGGDTRDWTALVLSCATDERLQLSKGM